MSQYRKETDIERKEDRISALPRDVKDRIVELLPNQDAARTSILSKKWRYSWSTHPYLVLDRRFFNELKERSQSFFTKTVYGILLLHHADIVKFVLDAPEDILLSTTEINRWILYVTRNGVKELSLSMPGLPSSIYKLPSYVFDCTTLTTLKLFNCAFKPPNSILGFLKLETLHLTAVTFDPTAILCVLNVPRLVYFYLIQCYGTQYLNIVSPQLEVLHVESTHYSVLNSFRNCKKLRESQILFDKEVDNLRHDERSALENFLSRLAPALEKLSLDSDPLELLSADTIHKRSPFMLNHLWFLQLYADIGKLNPTCGLLRLIQSAPNLSELEIFVCDTRDNAETVFKYLNKPDCLDRPLNKVKQVFIRWFQGSKVEFVFIKLLLACTPSLVRMSIEDSSLARIIIEDVRPGSSEERSIHKELIQSFPKASPNAELKFLQ